VGLTILFLAGVGTGLFFRLPFVPGFAGLFFILLFGFWKRWRGAAAQAALWVAVVWMGALRAGDATEVHRGAHLVGMMRRDAEHLAVRGTVRSDPAFVLEEPGRGSWRFVFRVEAVNRTGAFQPARGSCSCRMIAREDGEPVRYGDRWEFAGVVRQHAAPFPGGAVPPAVRMTVFGGEGELVARNQGNRLIARCLQGRRTCAAILDQGLEHYPMQAGILKALLLGLRSGLPDDLRETFAVTGTLHIFAISGLHVGVMALLLTALIKALGLPRHGWALLLVPLLILYTISTGMRPSAVRACVMAVTYFSASLAWRRPDIPSALALAALMIVAYEPTQLFAVGFLLSFIVVTGILVLYPLLRPPVKAALGPDPWLAGPESKPVQWARAGLQYFGGLFVLSIACWAASFPLTARFFNVFSPIALIGNLVVVPSAFLVVLTGCLSLMTGVFSDFPAEVFNHANRWFISLLVWVIQGLEDVPYGHQFVRAPPGWWLAAWYVLLCSVRFVRPRRRPVLAGALAVLLAGWMAADHHRPAFSVAALDNGGSVILHVAGRQGDLVVDPGSSFRAYDVGKTLREKGVDRLQTLFITRPDRQRSGALAHLLGRMDVGEIRLAETGDDPALLESLLAIAAEHGVSIRRAIRGDHGVLGRNVTWRVLSPPITAGPDEAPFLLELSDDARTVYYLANVSKVSAYHLAQSVHAEVPSILLLGDVSSQQVHPRHLFESLRPVRVLTSRRHFRRWVDDYASLSAFYKEEGVPLTYLEANQTMDVLE
jgi:ComEC/Rec2-related protein